jgi:outer membrane protein insertion porin family
MNESRQSISELYGVKGYFNVLIVPHFSPHDKENVVDVTYKITENELYYVHRIAFQGNTNTKDKVIRRQMRIAEGDLFNTERFKRSLFRIYQLGYFKEPQPKIEPSKEDPTKLDITIDLQEEGKNDIRVGGGISGVEGFFGTFAFSTRNLFGSGNSLTVDIQTGKRIKNYLLSYVDPYILDRPISGGADLFNRYSEYTDFERRGRGGQLQLGYQFSDFWFARTAYRYEDVDQQPRTRYDANGDVIPYTPEELLRLYDQRKVSSLQPVLTYSSIDNPTRPWRGLRAVASFQYAGGFLGGDTNLYKPRVDATLYLPVSKRTGLAAHGETSWVKAFGGQVVPLFEKFYLGGEQSIRGIPVYHVSPIGVDSLGQDVLLGGDKMVLLNIEYQIKIASPVSLVLFADAGKTWLDAENIDLSALAKSFGGEVRFWTPFLQAPLRLIYSYVPDPVVLNGEKDPHTNFTFSIGTTF